MKKGKVIEKITEEEDKQDSKWRRSDKVQVATVLPVISLCQIKRVVR